MTFEWFVMWVVVGLLTGILAMVFVKRGGRSLIGDVSLGLSGSLIASTLVQALWASADTVWLVAGIMFAGAAGVIAVQRIAWPRHV